MSCVNISSKEFKDTAKRLNVSSENLETIVNEIQNSLNDPDYFPSDEEIVERLHGTSFKASDAQAQLYELKNLGTPQEFSNLAAAMRQVSELQQWFPDEAVKCYKNANGIYEVHVARPISEKALREGNDYTPEMQSIKDKAKADGTFMKAPNGKPTNLNERQWLQVRTKAFKDWFGDWENDSVNASKVVDENGEPLVVYHGTKYGNFTIFNNGKIRATNGGSYAVGTFTTTDLNAARRYANIFNTPDTKSTEEYKKQSFISKLLGIPAKKIPNSERAAEFAPKLNSEANKYDYVVQAPYRTFDKSVYSLFLNIKNPKIIDYNGNSWNTSPEEIKNHYHIQIMNNSTGETRIIKVNSLEEGKQYLNNYISTFESSSEDLNTGKGFIKKQGIVGVEGYHVRNTKSNEYYKITLFKETVPATVNGLASNVREAGYDGLIVHNIQDANLTNGNYAIDDFIPFTPNQLKSATDNTGEFSTTNNDIRYSVLNEGRESSKSWETLVKEEPALKLLSKEQAQKVQQALKKHIKDEFTRATHPNIYKEYFNEANKQGYSFSTVTKAIDDIISKTNNTEIRVLAEFIKKYINKEVAKVSITYSTKNKGKETGDYDSSTKEITIYKKAANGVTEGQAKEAFEKTILHEVVHAITVDYLQSNSQAEKDIARIMRQLDNAIKSGNESLNIYAFESPYEFIAEFMSKPLLREATKYIPYQDVNGKTNVFKKIFDIIKNAFLNLSGKNKNITLYDKAMDALTNIMEDSYAYQNIESLENTTRDTQVSKESRIEKARRAIKIFKGKSKRAEEKNRKALIENYYSSIDIDTRQQVANYAIERLNSIYSNYTPTITEGQNIEEVITNKERELTKKFSKFVDSVKFEKNGDSYSLVITPKDISTVLRKNIEEAVNSKTAEEVVQELEAIESGVKFDPEYYLSNKKAEEAKRVISNRNNVQTEEEIDAALDFLKSLENTPDLNQYVSLCINWLKDNQIRLPEDNEKLIPLFEYAREHNMDTQKFKSVADLWKAIVNDKTAIAEKATPIEDPTSYYGITYNRTEKHKDGDILIFDVEDSERGQDSVCQILADFAPKLKNGKTKINSPWCLATFNYSASDKIATATNSAREFWKHYPNGKRQIAIMNGVPVAFNSSKYNRDEWWDYKDGCDNNYHGYSTIQEIDTNFLNISKLSFTNNSIRSLPLRNLLISPINRGEDYEVLSGEKDFSISEVKSLTNPDKVFTHLSLFGTTIPGHHFIKISIDKSDAVDLLFKVSPIRKRDLYLLEEEEEGKKTLQELDNTLAELYKMIHKAKQITNVTKKMVQPYRDSIEDNLTKLKNIADKILQEERERKEKEFKERQERRRALQATPTENTVTEAIQENEVLNTLSEAVNTNRPYETSREYEAAEEAEEYAQEVNREYGTNIEGETVRDAQEHVKARTLQEQYEKGVKQKVNKELSSQLHDILKRYHFEIIEEDLKQLFGEDALGALDILQKIVYLAKEEDRNALTDVEEFSHAFIELMGSKYRRETRENHPENKLYSDLRDLVEQTSLYQETLKQYRDVYQTRYYTPDLAKIKKEALGKALAATINNRFEAKTEADKSFFKKIKQWFKDVIQTFKGLLKGNEDRLIAELNKIADSILDGTYDKKYLKDSGIEGLLNQNYQEVIEGQTEKDGGRTLSIMQTLANKGLAVGGSLALRAQGTVYRSQIESLHDLDYSASPAVHNISLGEKDSFNMTQEEQEAFAQKAINSPFIQDLRNSLPANDIVSAYKANRNGIVSFIICDDASIRERFINDSGSYSDRLSKFTQEERDKITLLDVFLNEYTKKSKNLTDGTKVLDSSEIFDAKLRMGRAKDIFDYQHFNPASREQRANRNVMFQKNETPIQQSAQPVQQSTEQATAKTKTIEYTPKGKTRQTYTVEGNRIFNKNGVEVFQADSKDRRRIFANLAIQEGRAVIVEYKGEQYVVNNRDQIISIKTGNEVWKNTPKNNNRLAIIEAARQKFATRNVSQQATTQNIQMPSELSNTNANTINIYTAGKGKSFTNHSGGAKGSDTYWGEAGKKYGVESNHYHAIGAKTPSGNTPISEEMLKEADPHLKKANETLKRTYPTSNEYVNNLLRRNWWQVKNSDAVFAVGHLVRGIVEGGTGWAVQMAIDNGKPVYVFDQVRNKWYKNINNKWNESEVPILTKNFAGIGTRELNDTGRKAIEAVYEKTFGKSTQESNNTARYGVEIDPNLKSNYAEWQKNNPKGIVAYRVNYNYYNTAKEALEGRIGNPFSEASRGEDTVNQFYNWLITGNNFGNSKATAEYRLAIIQRILNTPEGSPILYYKELGRASHATILGYLVNHKELFSKETLEALERFNKVQSISKLDKIVSTTENSLGYVKEVITDTKTREQEVTENLDAFFTAEERKKIEEALGKDNRKLRVVSASRRSDPVFFSEQIIKMLENNAKLPIGHPERIYAIEVWSKHDGLPMVDILKACQKYRVAPMVSFSISTLGNTVYEKGVLKYNDLLDRIEDFVKQGILNPSTTTFRVDPILPGVTNLEDIEKVVARATKLGIKHFVTSIMQSYGNTEGLKGRNNYTGMPNDRGIVQAFREIGYDWETYYGFDGKGKVKFLPKEQYIGEIREKLIQIMNKYNMEFKSCSFNRLGLKHAACLDPAMIEAVTGVSAISKEKTSERSQCDCYGYKSDALKYSDKCLSSCLYCYAGHGINTPLQYYNDDGSINKSIYTETRREEQQEESFEPTVNTNTKKNQLNKSSSTIKDENKTYMEKTKELVKQIDSLYNSPLMSVVEIRHVANQMAYWVSDAITEYQNNPEKVFENFPNKRTLIEQDGKEVWTEENKAADLEKIKSYESRIELVNYIGIENLLTLCKERLVDDDVTSTWEYTSTIDKADLIYDNFDAIMLLSSDTFRMLEGFSLSISHDGKTLEASEETETSSNIDNFEDNSTDIESQRTDGVVNRDWTVDVKTIDVINELSGAIKRMLSNCFILEDNGRVDEEGNKQYDPVKSEFGIKERIDLRTATNSILKWTQGAITVEQMIDKLKEKVEDHPWITQVIDTLSKKENAQLKSQFFSVFYKPFQTYSVVSPRKGKYISSIVNEETLLKQTLKNIEAQVKIGEHPLFTLNGINKTSLLELRNEGNNLWALTKSENLDFTNEEFVNNVATSIGYISNLLGYYISPDVVKVGLSEPALTEIKNALKNIINTLKQNQDNSEFNPFDFESGIKGNIRSFLRPLTENFEDLEVSSFYDCGKMYQSYSTPSYTAKLFQKFKLPEKDFESFIKEEFYTPWFHTGNRLESGWRNEWIRLLVTDSKAREIFKHKTQLNFNRKNYMKTMSDKELTLSIFTEYFSERASSKESMVPAWFRIATLSNKPSLEFIRFYSYRGDNYKDVITNLLHNVFLQELSRIQTVELRNLKEGDYGYIEHFDESGRKFLFLDYMNKYLKGGEKENTQLGKLIQKSLKEKLSTQEELKLAEFSKEAIKASMEEKAKSIVNNWSKNGIVKAAKNIENIGTSEEEILSNLENFVWNDTFASINILQLTVTDLAFYGNAVNLQKRLAQIHAPGIRGDVYATDFEGNPVSDTKFRTAKITDYFDLKSNIIENLKVAFDRKIKAADGIERKGYEMLKEALVGTDGIYHKINVTDGQGYSCPTSYRKKAFIFGRWTKEAEEIYKKIKDGKATYIEIAKAFQPFKPFVYSQIIKYLNISEAPLSSLKVPVQFKNSEYLLILADAILQGEETGRPNLLRAIFNVMEESHFDQKTGKYKTDGIDTIQFESTTKSGLSTPINIAEFIENPNGEALATAKLKAYIYKTEEVKGEEGEKSAYRMTNQYDLNVVDVIPFEDFSIQQEIPEHFKNHEQPQGSQERYITLADLENFDADGNVIKYNLGEKEVTAEEFKQEYEQLINQNIEEDINTLAKDLSLDTLSIKDRNIAISKILQKEILSSPRYGVDLFIACSVNEDGQFRIPLGDPIQSKRIEQLLNSIIKNRINKQEMPGGPLVQVTNFGTSRKLNIRFKDKADKTGKTLIKLRSEFKGTDSEYADYLAKHQGGIAYYEAFVPIYANELFTKFADKDGNIDVATIEQINPDLLKAIGYRIPTEDKYSMMPIKIVGFLPKEAGDAIMLPYEITSITGADFDVDKMYIMLKKLNIASRVIPKPGESLSEAEEDYFKHNKQSIRKYLIKTLNLKGKITNNKEYAEITARAESNADLQRKAIEREYNERLQRLNKNDDVYQERNDEIKSDKSFNKAEERREKRYNDNLEKLNNWKKEQLNKIERTKENEILKSKVNEEVDKFLKETRYQSSKFDNALEADLRKAYIDYMYHTIEDSLNTRVGRNNRIFDMTYEILTHESSVDKILNPGNFEEQKLMGYQVEAFRDNPDYTWEQIKGMKIKELKKLIEKDKNLLYIDDNIHFYNQNNAGGSLLGIFAVNKIAHAIIESGGVNGSPEYFINIDKATETANEEFTVAGMKFSGHMGYDVRTDSEGKLVGKTLGSLVAASADTAKDPVLSLLNINGDTVNVLNTLLRLGMPFRTAALFVSQDVIRNLLEEYNIKNISSKTSLGSLLSEKIKQIEKEYSIDADSELLHQDLTVEEMIDGLRPDAAYSVQYKTLRAFQKLRKIASATELINNATRANSMSDAVGPLLIDNLLAKYKAEILNNESCIVDEYENPVTIGRIQDKHPILKGFSETKELANDLFINMPERSADFTNILDLLSQSNLKGTFFLKGNTSRRILNKLSEFYKTALLMSRIGSSKEQLKYMIEEFPKEFIRENYKEKYPNNLLIQSILYSINEEGRATLKINTTGLDTIQKSKYADAWTELHKINPKLSTQLYMYNLYKGGIGFNPKTFMHLLPIYVKERLDNYIGTFRNLPSVDPLTIIDRFIRNNWTDKNLVPSVKYEEGQFYTTEEGNIVINEDNISQFKNLDWFISSNEELGTLYKRKFYQERTKTLIFEEVTPLGNNGEYVEIQETALNNTDKVIEDTSEESISKEEVLSDSAALSTEELYDSVMFKDENRDYKEDVKALISNVLSRIQKDNTIENNSQSREKIINMVEERLKSFNIEIDKEKLKKESKKLCN